MATLLAAGVAALLIAMQAVSVADVMDPAFFVNASAADGAVALNAVLAGLTLLLGIALPRRWAWLALLPGAGFAAALLGGVAILGGHGWDMSVAVLTAACVWQLGRWIVLAAGSPRLAEMALVDVVVGIGAFGVLVTLLGRVGLLRWWSIGLLTAAIGAAGLVGAARAIGARRAALVDAVTASRLGVVCAGLLAIQLGWIAIWIGAPEIMFDAVYAKAWLPQIWAQSGSIEPLIEHPVLNVVGFAQLVAVPGHALGGPDVGRYLQLLAWLAAVIAIWAWGRRTGPYGPLAALAIGVAPHVVWQSATAYDDLVLAMAALGLVLAVLESAHLPDGERPARAAFVLGLMAGACFSLKIHLAPLAFMLLGGWVLLGHADASLLRRLRGACTGAVLVAAPPLIVRWIELGNPVFPSYNNIFRSPYFPPVNDPLNFPFWPDAGLRGALTWMWEAVTNPLVMNEGTPPAAFGLLIGALFVALVIGWRRGASRAAPLVWLAILIATAFWWMQFRYLRYLLPTFFAATALVLLQVGTRRLGRGGVVALSAAAAVLLAVSMPTTIAMFWNVPQRKLPLSAALGRWDDRDYLRHVWPVIDALEAYDRAAPRGSMAVVNGNGLVRTLVDRRGLSPNWEIRIRLLADGALPAGPTEALRRLRSKGVGWALVFAGERDESETHYLAAVVARHGEIVFADRGWSLYRLVDTPSYGRALPCDPRLLGRPGCWVGPPTLDREPGVSAAEAPAGVSRTLAVCGGQTISVRPDVAPQGAPARVTIDFDGSDPLLGLQTGQALPGMATRIFGTAPRDAHSVAITVIPGAGGLGSGGLVRSIAVGVKGDCATAP